MRPITGYPYTRKPSKIDEQLVPEGSPEQILLGAKTMHLVLVENWGNPLAIGLTGIEIIEGADNVLKYNI